MKAALHRSSSAYKTSPSPKRYCIFIQLYTSNNCIEIMFKGFNKRSSFIFFNSNPLGTSAKISLQQVHSQWKKHSDEWQNVFKQHINYVETKLHILLCF